MPHAVYVYTCSCVCKICICVLTVVFQYTHVSVYDMLHLKSIMKYAIRKGIIEIQV